MPKAADTNVVHQGGFLFERIAAICAALVVVGLVVFLLIRNEPVGDARLFLALRVVLSLGAAVLGATIPGFLEVNWSGSGLAVRAGGALALFLLTFFYTPDLINKQNQSGAGGTTPDAALNVTTTGNQSPVTANTRGPVTVNIGSPQGSHGN